MPSRLSRSLLALLLALALGGELYAPVATAQRKGGDSGQEEQRLTAGEAAAIARSRHGGQVLKVTRSGKGFRVKLLLDNGRVITVTIKE